VPDDIDEFAPDTSSGSEIGLLNLMRAAGLTESNSEGRRMIEQNAVSIDGEKVEDTGLYIDVAQETPFVLQVGKRRYVKVVANGSA
jgi:tyrosyl-tRNA synthetase